MRAGRLYLPSLFSGFPGSILAHEMCPGLLLVVGHGSPQKSVIHAVRVNIPPRDRIGRIIKNRDGALTGACARSLNVELRDSTVRKPQEAVVHPVPVNVSSREIPRSVDVKRFGALPRARACA